MLTQDDIAYMRRTAYEYDALLERWKYASAGSQEVANLHATFKARGGEVGRMVENGLFRRILTTLDAGVTVPPEATPEMLREIALRFAFDPQQEDLDMAAEAWRAALRAAGVKGTSK